MKQQGIIRDPLTPVRRRMVEDLIRAGHGNHEVAVRAGITEGWVQEVRSYKREGVWRRP